MKKQSEKKEENYRYLLNSFFQPQFQSNQNNRLVPFTSEFDFKFSNPLEKIQSQMKDILKETSSSEENKIQLPLKLSSVNNFDNFKNVEILIKRANMRQGGNLKSEILLYQ